MRVRVCIRANICLVLVYLSILLNLQLFAYHKLLAVCLSAALRWLHEWDSLHIGLKNFIVVVVVEPSVSVSRTKRTQATHASNRYNTIFVCSTFYAVFLLFYFVCFTYVQLLQLHYYWCCLFLLRLSIVCVRAAATGHTIIVYFRRAMTTYIFNLISRCAY